MAVTHQFTEYSKDHRITIYCILTLYYFSVYNDGRPLERSIYHDHRFTIRCAIRTFKLSRWDCSLEIHTDRGHEKRNRTTPLHSFLKKRTEYSGTFSEIPVGRFLRKTRRTTWNIFWIFCRSVYEKSEWHDPRNIFWTVYWTIFQKTKQDYRSISWFTYWTVSQKTRQNWSRPYYTGFLKIGCINSGLFSGLPCWMGILKTAQSYRGHLLGNYWITRREAK